MDLKNLTITKAREMLDNGEITSLKLTELFLGEIEKRNKDINALLEVFSDAKEEAKKADERIRNGEKKPLLGIPFVIKDNILWKGKISSSASKILEGYVAPYDATVSKKLREEGAVLLGRANMDEFAMGASTENSAYGVTKNPIDLTKVSGGSSGGSAASVSADFCLFALGSDTGGSIRQPASFCGVVGFKPSYGVVSRHGLTAMASSLDHIGPFAKNVNDAELVFKSIYGKDLYDATSVDISSEVKKVKKIGIYKPLLNKGGISKDVLLNFDETVSKLQKAGYEVSEVDLPHIEYSIPVYYIIVPAEVSSNMARFDGVKFGQKVSGSNLLEDYLKTRGQLIGKEVKRRILVGTYVLSAGYYDSFYGKATKLRELIKKDLENAFEKVDVLFFPTTANPAFNIGEKANDPLSMYLEDIFTSVSNLCGVPAISIPSGKTEKGLPLGAQFIGKYKEDFSLLEFSKEFEKIV